MIKNKRDLALALNNGGIVEVANISKKLSRIVEMWISYGDIKKVNNSLIGNF